MNSFAEITRTLRDRSTGSDEVGRVITSAVLTNFHRNQDSYLGERMRLFRNREEGIVLDHLGKYSIGQLITSSYEDLRTTYLGILERRAEPHKIVTAYDFLQWLNFHGKDLEETSLGFGNVLLGREGLNDPIAEARKGLSEYQVGKRDLTTAEYVAFLNGLQRFLINRHRARFVD